MKTNQNTMYYTLKNCLNVSSFLRMWKRLRAFRGSFSFDIYQYLKAENEKLQIVYANIRV